MRAFGHSFFVTATLWCCAFTSELEPECDEPVVATGAALLQSRRQKIDLAEYRFDVTEPRYEGSSNHSDLAKHCLARSAARTGNVPPPALAAKIQSQMFTKTTTFTNSSCSGITLVNFVVNSSSSSCCPADSLSCGGCASYASGKCQKCLDGYGMEDGVCVACIGTAGWTNELGATCDAIDETGCNDRPVNGQSSNQACCLCKGGHKSPTPFKYPDTRFVVGAAVDLAPTPRTAKRYSLNADCGFAAHNLTMDGETGKIHYIASRDKPTKPFSIQCEVTAHQGVGLVQTSKVSVAVDFLTYGTSALIFSPTVQSFSLTTSGGEWKDYSMVCAPEAPWLSISNSGHLSASSGSRGAITEAESGDGDYVGMDGAVCVVSGYQKEGGQFLKRSSTFVAVQPKPWPGLSYESNYLEVVVGEEVKPLKPRIPLGYEESVGGLRPSSFQVSCIVDGDWAGDGRPAPNWSFDSIWGVGLLGSHEILEVQPDGTISIAPGESMAKLFDEVLADNLQRKSVLLSCGVWGSFPGSDFPALHTPLMIRIKDSVCWISESFKGSVVSETQVLQESQCRNTCRMSKKCSHFTWGEDKCKHYRIENEGGIDVTAYAKVTGCADLNTCLRLKHPKWVLAGDYCPVAFRQAEPDTISGAVRAIQAPYVKGDFQKQGSYMEQTKGTCYSATQDCGVMEFPLTCLVETKVKFQAEIIAPDGNQDSFWAKIKGVGSKSVWHTGTTSDWDWSPSQSPELTAPAGASVVQFYGREKLKVKTFKIVKGLDSCKFTIFPDFTRNVVYRKQSSIEEEVMYLTAAKGASSCANGNWLVTRADKSDFVDEQLGYFELKGAEELCLDPGLPSKKGDVHLDYATLACGRPLFPETEEEQLQPLIFDDPSTTQPDDFWLHPCDCLPMGWGSAWPADAMSLENLPPASNGAFVPPPFLIVSGQFACPSRQLLKGAAGIHFESEAESMEPSDCEERCKDFKTCTFYWTGTSHGATTCRLYEGCDSLVREFGMEGDLYALPHNASCQVANPEGCWKTSLRKQFLTQKEGVSPSYTRGAVVMNVGGLRSWTGNSTGTKSRDVTYIEPFGNMSTIKLLGWSYLQSGMGFVRDVPGISTAVVEGLNPNKDYKYSIKQLTNTNSINNKVTVNHGSQQTLTQFSRRRGYNKEGTVAATPRGELVFDFEAPNYPLNVHDRTSGTSSGTASESCRRRYKVTGCTCYAESGLCTGSKVDGANCYAYGTMDVHGATGKSISVRAKVRCMELPFANSYSVQTSSGPSFSFLESFNDTDEGDREVSLDAVGKARDEDDESEENLLESAEETEDVDEESEDTADAQEDEDEEGVKDFETGEQESEDGNMHVDIQDHSMSLLEEGESSASDSQGWRRRRRRRRRRRTRRRRSRRRRSRRRRSRRRRTLPTSVSSTCPSGEEVLSCNCYPDSFTEKAHVWTVTHHCKEVWKSGRSCHAKGGYAQAVCAKLPAPATRNWQEKAASGRYWTNKDEGPTATCPSDRTLLGCWCKSTSHRGDNCARVWADGNSCRARANGVRAHTSHVDIHVTANCATMKTSLMILSELKIELQQPASLAETPVVEARAIGHLAPLSFEYMHLHQQCDSLLLMGGIGVEHCSRPNYRKPNYHPWQQKKVLPMSFVHGSELKVGCWKERFESFRSKTKVTRETLHCVNGDWFNSVQSPEMGAFSCEPCVLVGGGGYSKYAKRNEQELYFFSRMAVRVYTELGSVVETSAAAHKFCLKKHKTLAHSMMLENEQECPEILAIQLSTSSEVQERMMLLLDQGAPDNNQCLEAVVASDGVSPFVAHKTCNPDNVRQEISPMAIPEIMWEMHSDADRNSGEDLHSAFSSYCGAHGALSSLSFGQIFGGDIGGTKSNCHFAPVIKFGKFVDSTITYDKTSTNWPDWNTLLADSPILCADGEALTGFKHQPASNKFRYECSRIGGLGAKYEYFSAQVEVKAFDANRANFIESLKMITVDCGMNGLLSGFHFEFSEGGRWACSKYTCSKAGGAPVVMEPSTMIEALIQDTEGVFCPKTLDVDTGRYEYENIITGDKLNFQSNGAWCVASDCSAAVGGATPVGVVMTTHEVLNVTDFDGHFEAKGVPKLEGDSAKDLAKRLKALKPPKRPAQPPKPSLQVYKAEMPQYAEECLNYQGDINRDLVAAKTAYGEAAYDLVASAIQEGIKLVCAMPPDAEIAPLGAGVEVEPDSICDQVTDFVRAMIDLPVGFSFASFDLKLEEEGFNACNPLQVGFARVFCDIHCVRDAVIRGDRSILKNLEKATKISNDNMKKMVDWSTEANRAETEYLDKKIDHSLKVNTIYLEHISKNTEPILIKNTAAATKAMLDELQGYAEASSFSTVSRRGTQDALQSFLVSAQQLEDTNKTSRLSQVQGFQRQVELLHESLKMNSGTLNRAQVVGRQIRSEVQKLQKRFAEQERALSIYRTHSSSAQKTAKQWKQEVREASRSLVSLDHLWWRLRNHLDGYLDSADVEIRRVQASFLALENYENCKSGFEELLKSYASSMSKMKKSHQKLKSTWREVSNLMGEMASIIRDGDLFGHVMRAEGCESPLAKQTLDQARFAVQGMVFLLHRFQASSLPFPDTTTLKQSATQIQESYKTELMKCRARTPTPPTPTPDANVLSLIESWIR